MLGESWAYWRDNGLYNCYIGDVNKAEYAEYNDNIFCLFDKNLTQVPVFDTFQNEVQSAHVNYIDSYTVSDTNSNYVMYVFDVPNNLKEQYNTFLESKYSCFSSAYKDQIFDFFGYDKQQARYEIPVGKKLQSPTIPQILFPKTSDRDKYIKEKTGCKYEGWWEIIDRINEKEVFGLSIIQDTNQNSIQNT